jgi:hypothetical protein
MWVSESLSSVQFFIKPGSNADGKATRGRAKAAIEILFL